jgi:hypothetical protein
MSLTYTPPQAQPVSLAPGLAYTLSLARVQTRMMPCSVLMQLDCQELACSSTDAALCGM